MISEEKEKTKISILKTAKNLFYDIGYENTTIGMIAEKLNISKGTITYYYPTKIMMANELIEQLKLYIMDIVMEKMMKMYHVYDPLLGVLVAQRLHVRWLFHDKNAGDFFAISFNENLLNSKPVGWDYLEKAYLIKESLPESEYQMSIITTRAMMQMILQANNAGYLKITCLEIENFIIERQFDIFNFNIDPKILKRAFLESYKVMDKMNFRFLPYFVIE